MNPSTLQILIRPETGADILQIEDVTRAALADHPHSNQREHYIVNALRTAGALSVSLVAELGGEVIGHIAFSPVTLSNGAQDWYGLGPLSVAPGSQRRGAGTALVMAGLTRLCELNAGGCVVAGDPAYFCRFGFKPAAPLFLPEFPPEYFSVVTFAPGEYSGAVAYHPAFEA